MTKVYLRVEDGGSKFELDNTGVKASIKEEGFDFNFESSWADLKNAAAFGLDVVDPNRTWIPRPLRQQEFDFGMNLRMPKREVIN